MIIHIDTDVIKDKLKRNAPKILVVTGVTVAAAAVITIAIKAKDTVTDAIENALDSEAAEDAAGLILDANGTVVAEISEAALKQLS